MANSTVPQTSLGGKKVKPFGLADKFGYMFGDLANGFLFIGMSMFLAGYYRDVLGLNPLAVGTMMMVIKFLDAFTDIGMGRICDRFRGTKAGKFKPWILWLAGPVALSSFLMYQSYMAGTAEWVKWTYAAITYILFNSIFYTGINIPYGSMASAMVTSPQERAQLSAFRGLGPTLAGLLLGVIPIIYPALYVNNKTQAGPMMVVAGILAVLSVGVYIACYFMCTERVDLNHHKGQQVSILKSLKNIFTSRAFIILAIVTIIQVTTQLAVSDINRYLYGVVFYGTPGFSLNNVATYSSLYSIIGSIAVIVAVTPLTILLVKKFGKKNVTIFSTLGGAVGYFLLFAFGPILRKNVWAYLFSSLVPFIITGAMTAITFAFITDIVDDMEVKNGVREDAPVYGIYSFIRKLAQGIATQLGGVILTVTKYDPNKGVAEIIGKDPNGLPIYGDALQAGAAVPMFNIFTLGYAIGFLAIGLLFLFLYPLGKKKVEENARILREKRAALAAAQVAPTAETVVDTVSPEDAAGLEAAELVGNEELLHNKNLGNDSTNNDLNSQLDTYNKIDKQDNNDDNNKE